MRRYTNPPPTETPGAGGSSRYEYLNRGDRILIPLTEQLQERYGAPEKVFATVLACLSNGRYRVLIDNGPPRTLRSLNGVDVVYRML